MSLIPARSLTIAVVAAATGRRLHMGGQRLIALVLAMIMTGGIPVAAQGRSLEKCARGQLEVCFAILARPRLEPGRRAAIEWHLAEVDKLAVACNVHDKAACAELASRYPDLPPDMTPRSAQPDR